MEKLFAKIKKEKLTPAEKSEILSSIKNFVYKNPTLRIKSPFYNVSKIYRSKTFVVTAIILFVFITSSSGTIFASKYSLPGDILYPIKIMNEQVESLVTFGSNALAKLEAVHAISRLQEAEKLAVEGKLDNATRREIESKFVTQTNATIKNIKDIKQGGNPTEALKVTSDFQKSLSENETTITQLINHSDTKTEAKQELTSIISNVQTQLQKTSIISEGITASSTTATSTSVNLNNNTSTSTETVGGILISPDNASSTLEKATSTPLDLNQSTTTIQKETKFNSFIKKIIGK